MHKRHCRCSQNQNAWTVCNSATKISHEASAHIPPTAETVYAVPHDAVKHATDDGRIFPRFMVPVPHVRIQQAVRYQAKGALGGEFLVRWNHGDAQIHGTVAVTCEWTTGQRTELFILLVQRDLVDIPEAADPDPQVAGTVQTILGPEDGIHFRASYMGYHGGAIELAGEGFALSCLAAAQERE